MSVVDLHPEDLLDKDAHGALEDSERARLEAHVAHCSACRLERQLRADFASELEAHLPLERFAGLGSLGQLAIDAMPAPARKSDARTMARGPRRRRTKLVWLLAAAALLVGGAAAAMNGLGEGPWSRFVAGASSSAPPAAGTTEAPRPKIHRAPAVTLPEPAPLAEVAAPSSPELTAQPSVAAAHAMGGGAAVAAPAHKPGPADLFEVASDARRRGDYGRVLDADRELDDRYPTSREAQVLRAIVGRVLLDRGDPTGALARFDSYLAAGGGELGELAHECMVGRATALDRLGRSDEATKAWSALVASFPDTPYAAHVRARLEKPTGR
jgi:TolA-binding protein